MHGQLTLAVHRALEDRLERESAALLVVEQSESQAFAEYVAHVRQFKQVSDRRLLDAGRALAGMLVCRVPKFTKRTASNVFLVDTRRGAMVLML